jgi:hypothetical protein
MWTSRSGQIVALTPHRVGTLLAFARSQGKTRLLGVPIGHCGSCTADAVTQRIGQLARSARATGTVQGDGKRYAVFESTALGRRHRLFTRPAGDGRHQVIWLDGLPSSAVPGPGLKRLELEAEDEVNRRALTTALTWTREPVDHSQLARFANRDGVYIMVDPTLRPLKVGLTSDPTSRFKAYKKHPTAKFFVATLRDAVTTKHPAQVLPTIEHAVANAIRRAALSTSVAGLDPIVHQRPVNPFRATGKIEISNVLPVALRAKYPVSAALSAVHVRGAGPRFDSLPTSPAGAAGTLSIPRGKLFEAGALQDAGAR